jgi:ketosteroid isomerase-like protein
MLLHEPAAVDLADESVILGRAMSLQNVELVRQLYEAAERRDLETLEMLGSEEGEFHSVLAASEGRVFRGRQGIRDYFAAIDAAFDDWQPEIEELIDAGDDRVVALIHVSGAWQGERDLPRPARRPDRDRARNRICFIDSYFNQSEALAAAGLRE